MCPLDGEPGGMGFATLEEGHRELQRGEPEIDREPSDLRGRIHRPKRLMSAEEVDKFLRAQKVAHVGTVDVNGWPYVVPLVYVYEGGDQFSYCAWHISASAAE